MNKIILINILFIIATACDNGIKKEENDQTETGPNPGTFSFDQKFLSGYDNGLVELRRGDASVLVSPKYQGKVFTSTANRAEGKSFGWINYEVFNGPVDPHMNAFGGENRLWLGPEGGKYSLYFKKGDTMVFEHWKTPAPIDTEPWNVVKNDSGSVTMKKDMTLTNYAGTPLSMQVMRTVAIQDKKEIEGTLSVKLGDSIRFVGYTTNNALKNTGAKAWTEQTGMPCIWILDMFNPSDSTTIVIPHKPAGLKKVATTDYFGEIGKDRILFSGNTLFFKADGRSRGKLGILPQYVLPFAGSYDAVNNVLTITSFTVDNNAKYLNQEWNTSKPAFSGDAMNAYNDGPLADGSQMGPFYEIESVSPAAALNPAAEMKHVHNVYHFTGNKDQLDAIALKVLGVSLSTIRQAFE